MNANKADSDNMSHQETNVLNLFSKKCQLCVIFRILCRKKDPVCGVGTQSLVTSLAGLKSAVLAPATVATVAGTNTADLRSANQSMSIVQLQYTSTQNSTKIEPL